MAKKGLYHNIHARRKAGKKPRPPGAKGRPTDKAFRDSAKTRRRKSK